MKLIHKIREHGLVELTHKFLRFVMFCLSKIGLNFYNLRWHYILKYNRNKVIIYLPPYTVWFTPLFQRPHYLALELAKLDVLYIFGTVEDWRVVHGLRSMATNLYLCNDACLIDKIPNRKKFLHLYSTDNVNGWEYVEAQQLKGWKSIYEFIDEFDERVFLSPIKQSVRTRHERLMNSPSTILVGSARRLIEQMPVETRREALYIPNGVKSELFHPRPADWIPPTSHPIASLLPKFKHVVGYYGALASWVDWDLLDLLAHENADTLFVFIGPRLDNSLDESNILKSGPRKNILFLEAVKHTALPELAWTFDYAWIPFKVNEITLSTSPLKIFEYLSMGLPVISTALPEVLELAQQNTRIQIISRAPESFVSAISKLSSANQVQSSVEEFTWKHHAEKYVEKINS
jgi:teichuronic acid biosynthesis glycosyltransferase TuaH